MVSFGNRFRGCIPTNRRPPKIESVSPAVSNAWRCMRPLEPLHVPINPATLVVGGGIAGIQAALEIADSGFPVVSGGAGTSIGGHMAQFDKTFPTLDCSACILTPKMVSAGTHPNITLLTWSEVEQVDGYVGNFTVTCAKKPAMWNEDVCTGCGICIEKCPKKWSTTCLRRAGLSQGGLSPLSRRLCPNTRSSIPTTASTLSGANVKRARSSAPPSPTPSILSKRMNHSGGCGQHHPGYRL
jgi:ferredoxin